MKFTKTIASNYSCLRLGRIVPLLLFLFCATGCFAQTVLLDFNTVGQYTNNFNPWNDNGGGNGGNYSFMESLTAGVGGGGGVSVFQSNDTTATYKNGSWDFSTNGATIFLSVLMKANGIISGNKVQLGILNSNTNGLNGNANVAFESFRFIPNTGTNTWSLREQSRTTNASFEVTLGNVTYSSNRWYKFVVALTNTSSSTPGTYNAGCAIYDFGANGLTPGTNIVTFSTAQVHTNPQDIATNKAVWPAFRAYQNGGVDAWDNFLVFTTNSKPVFTIPLTNTPVPVNQTATFVTLADGPGTITYAWYTNGVLVSGSSGSSYTSPPITSAYTNISVVAGNNNGSATNSASITAIVPVAATVTNLPASNILQTAATLNGQVLATGGDPPAITIYYGTNNGGASASAWSNNVSLGIHSGAFGQAVSGLSANTTYYFTAKAVNSGGTSWASPSASFSTLALVPPVVTNLPATVVTSTSATLNGQVVATGGTATTINVYYGLSDGGANAAAWSNSIALGIQSGAFSIGISGLSSNTTYFFTCRGVNSTGTTWASPSLSFQTPGPSMTPIALTGFNRDMIIENTASGPPFTNAALEFNPGENTAFYQSGLAGKSYGLPASGSFLSAFGDGTSFQFQPYTGSNALVMSSDTGVSSGTLSLSTPTTFSRIAILANSGSGGGTANVTLNFSDSTSYATTYSAPDWFFNTGFALQGVDRINLTSGATDGGPAGDPRFYQTTIDLAAALGATNKPLSSLTFSMVTGVGATAIYAVSGLPTNAVALPQLVNNPATNLQATAATIGGNVTSSGGETPAVTIYYGPVDGGSIAAAWSNSIALGRQSGVFSQPITGLTSSATYFFTAKAVNSAGTAWAALSQSFTTPGLALATVTNLPATGIQANAATLNGQVLATGNDVPSITIFYGTTDGGTNAPAWSNNVAIGPQSAAYAQTVSSLSTNTTYFFASRAVNSAGASWASPSGSFTTPLTNAPGPALAAVLTYHNDNTRQGVNTNESILTLANVNTNSFGRVFSYTLDGFVYAQPLIMTNVSIPGKGLHNVVYVATEHDSVYAFDADDGSGANSSPLWQASFINPGAGITTVPNGDVGTTDITPEVGITATPVIDSVSGTIYVEVKTKEGSAYVHRLHALDIATGLERTNFNSPSVISSTNYPGAGTGDNDGANPPHVLWNPLRLMCRPALTLLNGVVYLSYASHGDNQPYHGWLFAYSATNVSQQLSVYNATPNGGLGGFWDGGGGPSVDPQGNLYLQTGNGTFDGGLTVTTSNNYAMSVMKFATTNGITFIDYFAPSNAVALSGGDQDLGSSAPIILPDSAGSGTHPHLVVGGGKTSPIYVMDRDNMGRFNGISGTEQIVQVFNGSANGDRDTTPAFFNNTLYVYGQNSRISAFKISSAAFNTTPVQTPDTFANKGGATVCISANGTNNAIAWAIYNSGGQSPSTPAVLRAYNATNISLELYASDQAGTRDAAGNAVKFITPTIANGKVYVGAQYSLTVYGNASAFVAAPTISPNGGLFTNSVNVTLNDATPGAAIYYTLDGTTPTTNSTHYTLPFVISNSVPVTAKAFKAGSVDSAAVSASFINSATVGHGNGLLGSYWSNTTSAAFTNVSFSAAPSLIRTDATVNFNWGTGSPDPTISTDNFVVRWTGSVQPQFTEGYTFYTVTDDGVRLWLNGQLLIDKWVDQGPTTWTSSTINLVAQQRYNIRMEYYEHGGGAQAQLFWSGLLTGPQAIIPQTQLYSVTNPPPSVVLTSPTAGSSFTASASVTFSATAASQYNTLTKVDFYAAGAAKLGTVSNSPYILTMTGLGAGGYSFTAVATDASGVSSTSAPVSITVNSPTGLPYGLTSRTSAPAFYAMPNAIPPTLPGSLPLLLSLTGVFSNTPSMVPVSSLIPYAPNVPLWSDAAVKTRWMSVPNSGAPYTPDEQIAFATNGEWTFPAGTVFVKDFQLVTNEVTGAQRRLETRLLVRDINGAVYGVTYKWRPDNSDADLLTASLSEDVAITNAAGVRTQTWYYPSPTDCLLCHTPEANYVLGVKTRQLNGSFTYPSTGVTDNQLRTLNRIGLLNPAIDEGAIAGYSKLSALNNLGASLEERARSYLDANCAQCHRPGGSGPTMDARYDTPLTNQNIINAILAKANLGDTNTRVVVPRDIWRSLLYYRMNTTNDLKMPTLARNLIDTNAVAVMGDWINSLNGTPALAPPIISPNGGTFVGSTNVTLLSTNAGASIYYTFDGSLPTTNSILYSGPFAVISNTLVTASAFESGFNNSFAASAQFVVRPPIYFTSVGFSNSVFVLGFSGLAGKSYVLSASTDLTNWSDLSTNIAPANLFNLTDPSAGNSQQRFYRARELP